MKIAHTNDLHYLPRIQLKLDLHFEDMAATNPDIITIAGDHTGNDPDAVRKVFELARKHFSGPIVACLGNHDYWVHDPIQKDQEYMTREFEKQMRQAVQAAEDNNVHLLEEHGIWSSPEHYGICILGHGGWYFRGHRSSNDYAYLPRQYQGLDINEWMNKRAEASIRAQIAALTDDDWTRIGMVHMPVGNFDLWEAGHCGNQLIGDLLAEAGVKKILNGHIHNEDHHGPRRYQAGSDYGNPRFITLGVV